jgi:membrane protease YdiL (CAAX protease family)
MTPRPKTPRGTVTGRVKDKDKNKNKDGDAAMAKPVRSSSDPFGPAAGGPFWTGPYWQRAQRPLEILLLLAPLIVIYELGLIAILRQDGGVLVTNLAHKYIIDLFSAMGITGFGLGLPGLLLVILLFVWQVLSRNPWAIHWGTIGLMWIESFILVIPIIVIAALLNSSATPLAASIPVSETIAERMAMGIGAGLYEELIFRWAIIATVHALLVDGFGVSHRVTVFFAVVISAVAFMLYHPIHGPDGSLLSGLAVFYLASGAYFSMVYILRGFGIVAATHAVYDVFVVLLASSITE